MGAALWQLVGDTCVKVVKDRVAKMVQSRAPPNARHGVHML